MGLRNYGVLKGRIIGYNAERASRRSPHLHISLDARGQIFRAAINVKSAEGPSEVVYLAAPDYAHPQLSLYPSLAPGITRLERRAGSGALDFIRGNMFDVAAVTALPYDAPGRDDDLLDRLELHLKRANGLGEAVDAYVFGEPFSDGIHNVHMNQGSIGAFAGHNGVWQDGALLLHDRAIKQWTALFLAFQSQAVHTDDNTGHALPGSATFADIVAVLTPHPAIRIVAALVNPNIDGESVTLLNTGPAPVDLAGWSLASGADSRMVLRDITIAAGKTVQIAAQPPFTLPNQGGIISLLDPVGVKVDGVSYIKAQATTGTTIIF